MILETREEKMSQNLFIVIEFSIILILDLLISWIFNVDFYKVLFALIIISMVTSAFSFVWNLIKYFKEELS